MRIDRNTVRTMVVAAVIGTAGVTGAAVASADTVTELNPQNASGAYCTVTDDTGATETLYTTFDCLVAQTRIDNAERDAERIADREARRDEQQTPQF